MTGVETAEGSEFQKVQNTSCGLICFAACELAETRGDEQDTWKEVVETLRSESDMIRDHSELVISIKATSRTLQH